MVVLPNLPSCRERFYEPEKEITSDSEIPNAMRINDCEFSCDSGEKPISLIMQDLVSAV